MVDVVRLPRPTTSALVVRGLAGQPPWVPSLGFCSYVRIDKEATKAHAFASMLGDASSPDFTAPVLDDSLAQLRAWLVLDRCKTRMRSNSHL